MAFNIVTYKQIIVKNIFQKHVWIFSDTEVVTEHYFFRWPIDINFLKHYHDNLLSHERYFHIKKLIDNYS